MHTIHVALLNPFSIADSDQLRHYKHKKFNIRELKITEHDVCFQGRSFLNCTQWFLGSRFVVYAMMAAMST